MASGNFILLGIHFKTRTTPAVNITETVNITEAVNITEFINIKPLPTTREEFNQIDC